MGDFTVAVMIAAAFVAVFWVYQFIQLMLLSDTDFPGKYDKILWVVAFIFAFCVAPFAFLSWKTAYRMMRRKEL
jgi:ABC-type bacteriocin/lantibiotic exporter with double-glycine peptidase domain